ncbi:glycosyltransferase [Campylobacter sp. MIT 21-1685]|uniref:glycosyltransferase family 2 protein n=1 Tax=unclassified Campylobacter TaxID=2593542 RepID=UPI00224A660E|nr:MULTISPECIES: glycosyltransferase [unclassified Campylobacter]MCX2683748.1 glycosyltransferase [Campylobacter sp. MIT 21-1684]MCX2752022.1 glycosyltransferase [Campylobacter sp. MIT 21-1682]MCX2808225.1 glycosyltransferase [Campylobacter sp. MIT 21-1685]
MNLKNISVIIIVKNAEKTLQKCLQSLKNFDEIVLLDNGSTDSTLEIAKEYNEKFDNLKVFHSKFIGFGALRNLAISYTKNDFILSIDADEVLEISTKEELETVHLKDNSIIALPRKNLYKNEWIKACGWSPDFVYRIFNKKFTQFNKSLIHESVIIPSNAEIVKFQNGLKHYAYDSIDTLLEKCQRYSSLWAQQNVKKKSSMIESVVRSGWKFFRDYFFKKGFLYGYKGFMISVCNALGVFFKYAKLYELTHQMPSASLIITTYNNEDYLKLVLESVRKLEYLPNEVIVADDGSTEKTADLIKEFKKDFPCPLKHIWQEDKGYRLNQSRNNGINAASCEYIIVIDGDMILDKNFIKDHLEYSKEKVYLQGSRILLDAKKSKNALTNKEIASFSFFKRNCFIAKCIYFSSKITASYFEKKELIKGIRGCNMSFFKKDWAAIEGFNERFNAWGRDDSEFVARFLFNGGELRRLKFKAIASHLYHDESNKNRDRSLFETNHTLYLETIQNKKTTWKDL